MGNCPNKDGGATHEFKFRSWNLPVFCNLLYLLLSRFGYVVGKLFNGVIPVAEVMIEHLFLVENLTTGNVVNCLIVLLVQQ